MCVWGVGGGVCVCGGGGGGVGANMANVIPGPFGMIIMDILR